MYTPNQDVIKSSRSPFSALKYKSQYKYKHFCIAGPKKNQNQNSSSHPGSHPQIAPQAGPRPQAPSHNRDEAKTGSPLHAW